MLTTIRTTAGRHAADRQRERDRVLAEERAELQLDAFHTLATALSVRPLRVTSCHASMFGHPPTIACKVRVEYCGVDLVFIEATLRDLGWKRSTTHVSRLNGRHDIRELVHAESKARLRLIIALPFGEPDHVEAA